MDEPTQPAIDDPGIPWLTTPQRDLLAHLSVLNIHRQLPAHHTYADVSDALGDLAAAGEVLLRADQENVWVIIHDQIIVHAARDWLEWMTQNWTAATSN
jgi:hypothetical protein